MKKTIFLVFLVKKNHSISKIIIIANKIIRKVVNLNLFEGALD